MRPLFIAAQFFWPNCRKSPQCKADWASGSFLPPCFAHRPIFVACKQIVPCAVMLCFCCCHFNNVFCAPFSQSGLDDGARTHSTGDHPVPSGSLRQNQEENGLLRARAARGFRVYLGHQDASPCSERTRTPLRFHGPLRLEGSCGVLPFPSELIYRPLMILFSCLFFLHTPLWVCSIEPPFIFYIKWAVVLVRTKYILYT